jgi:hypothetical protein
MTKGRVLAALMAAIALTFVVHSSTSAQYPPPRGSLICAISKISIQINETTTVSTTLIDIHGGAMSGQTVVFTIVTGGYVSSTVAVTDDTGTAYVDVTADGTSSQVVVYARFDGLQCQAMAQVLLPPPPPVIVEVLSIITPPKTGDAGLADAAPTIKDAPTRDFIAAGAIAFGLVMFGGVWQIGQRR